MIGLIDMDKNKKSYSCQAVLYFRYCHFSPSKLIPTVLDLKARRSCIWEIIETSKVYLCIDEICLDLSMWYFLCMIMC